MNILNIFEITCGVLLAQLILRAGKGIDRFY